MVGRRGFSGKTHGANIPNIRVYICASCQSWSNVAKPVQCRACGHMEFIHFPSKAEAKRYGELMLEQAHKFISDLTLQPRFPLHAFRIIANKTPNYRTKIGEYRGDFQYVRDGKTVVEDVKGGADTTLSVWKRKHAEAEHGIKIEIVRR